MKITHNKVGQNLDTRNSAAAEKTDAAKQTRSSGNAKASVLDSTDLGATKVDVSERAQQMKKAKEIATSAPDINEDKVSRLQKLIDEGKYKVGAKDIADRMVDDELNYN